MLTKEKIKIYKQYKGDIDMWVHTGRKNEKLLMSTSDWSLIDELLQGIQIVHKGLASNDFTETLYKSLEKNCENEETIIYLKQLSKKYE